MLFIIVIIVLVIVINCTWWTMVDLSFSVNTIKYARKTVF